MFDEQRVYTSFEGKKILEANNKSNRLRVILSVNFFGLACNINVKRFLPQERKKEEKKNVKNY